VPAIGFLRSSPGNPGKRRIGREPQPSQGSTVPPPPPYLSGLAATEWKRLAPELFYTGLLTRIDETMLAVYCAHYATWRTAMQVYDELGEDAPERHVLERIERKAAADMVAAGKQFGLTPLSRGRLGVVRGHVGH
jgi:P27 family predicted phage terminase small subunit